MVEVLLGGGGGGGGLVGVCLRTANTFYFPKPRRSTPVPALTLGTHAEGLGATTAEEDSGEASNGIWAAVTHVAATALRGHRTDPDACPLQHRSHPATHTPGTPATTSGWRAS